MTDRKLTEESIHVLIGTLEYVADVLKEGNRRQRVRASQQITKSLLPVLKGVLASEETTAVSRNAGH